MRFICFRFACRYTCTYTYAETAHTAVDPRLRIVCGKLFTFHDPCEAPLARSMSARTLRALSALPSSSSSSSIARLQCSIASRTVSSICCEREASSARSSSLPSCRNSRRRRAIDATWPIWMSARFTCAVPISRASSAYMWGKKCFSLSLDVAPPLLPYVHNLIPKSKKTCSK